MATSASEPQEAAVDTKAAELQEATVVDELQESASADIEASKLQEASGVDNKAGLETAPSSSSTDALAEINDRAAEVSLLNSPRFLIKREQEICKC